MDNTFRIFIDWESSEYGTLEEKVTAASLGICVNNIYATHVDDTRSRSTRKCIHTSAYPLALWLASSWWRLRWESSFPSKTPPLSWRMAHEVAASGYGYFWPTLVLWSDRENIIVKSLPTVFSDISTIRYMNYFYDSIPTSRFEREIEDFIQLTISRLHDCSVRDSELEQLWKQVMAERANSKISTQRMIEAQLGYDPDDAPEDLLESFLSQTDLIGSEAIFEIASACSGKDPAVNFSNAISLSQQYDIPGRIVMTDTQVSLIKEKALSISRPWERGWAIANEARKAWNISADRISNETLSEIIEIKRDYLTGSCNKTRKKTIGIAIRKEDNTIGFHFSGGVETSKRFEASRFIADHLLAPTSDNWLPATHAKTARQAYQRAFAAEFLCPIGALQDFLNGDYSEEAQEDAAVHFMVSPICVASNLANHRLIDPSLVPDLQLVYQF